MNIADFKEAQRIQLKIAAMKKLREMLGKPHVVLTSGEEPESNAMEVFGTIFGDSEKRLINKDIAEDMMSMVGSRILELRDEFDLIGREGKS